MVPVRNQILCLVLGLPASGAALEFATYPYRSQPRQQTEVREADGRIRTIFDDVATPTFLTQPGSLPNSRGRITVDYGFEGLYREDLADPAARDEGTQHRVDVALATHVWKRLSAELRTGLVIAESNDDPDVATLDVLSVVNLYKGRYRGGSLAFGVGVPIGSGKAFQEGHEGSFGDLAYLGQLRCTESFGYSVVHLNVSFRYVSDATYVLDMDRVTEDGDVLPEGSFGCSHLQASAALAYTYRLTRWLRCGGEGLARWDQIEGNEGPELVDYRFQVLAFVEVNPSREIALRVAGGCDPQVLDEDDGEAWAGHAGLVVRW